MLDDTKQGVDISACRAELLSSGTTLRGSMQRVSSGDDV